MATSKPAKPASRSRSAIGRARPAAAPVRDRRGRSHSLAPPHLGEAASAAILAVAVLGLAVFIAGVAMTVSGLTLGSRYELLPPPNIDELGTAQVFGGIGIAVLGVVLSGSALAVLADIARSRPIAAAASGVAAILAVVGVIVVQAQPGGDLVLGISLAVAAVIFAAAAVILVRPRR